MHDLLAPRRSRVLSPLPAAGRVDPAYSALVSADGDILSHGELRRRVEALADDLRTGDRRLAHVTLAPTVDDVIAYLAVLEAGHVPLLMPPGDNRALRDAWPADFTIGNGAPTPETGGTPRHLLHPDLALLLSTSGSTGSPKLVRLSHANVVSNAHAIAAALGLTTRDRGVTSLPLHYCFGLSVLHSHLAVGGSVALTDASVLDERLWCTVDAGVTTLAVVPHMVELMETTGVLDRPHPSLRLMTQAGGRMAEERIRRTAEAGRRHGWGLTVMYGQTEATARIAVQGPEQTLASPGTVGRAVPGTTVTLDTTVPEAADGSGEVIVRGPGVMLGYAEHPDDLALGRMTDELRTGDLGVLDHGVLRIVGRRAGFIKLLGLRIDMSRVEAALERDGLVACVTGDDTGLRIAVEPIDGEDPLDTRARARAVAAKASGAGVGHVRAGAFPLARLANGKIDRTGCDALVRASDPDECDDTRRRIDHAGPAVLTAGALGDVLGRDDIDLSRSFVAQGGDSLTHVQASTRLTAILGPLPGDWHHRPLGDLVDGGEAPPAAEPRRARWALRPVETPILLRAIAVVIICGSHAELFRILGGAHTLMAVAGFSAATFGLSALRAVDRWRSTARLLVGIGIPTAAVAFAGLLYGRYGWGNVFLVNWATGNVDTFRRNELWFVDALVLCLLVVASLLTVPRVSRWWRDDPWRVAVGLLAAALVSRFVILALLEGTLRGIMPTVMWLFAGGMALALAKTRGRLVLTLALTLAGAIDFFPGDVWRNAVIAAGIVTLALVRRVHLPSILIPGLTLLAAASLHIYLIQFHVLTLIDDPLTGTVASLSAGVLLWRLAAPVVRRIQDRLVPAVPVPPIPERTPA